MTVSTACFACGLAGGEAVAREMKVTSCELQLHSSSVMKLLGSQLKWAFPFPLFRWQASAICGSRLLKESRLSIHSNCRRPSHSAYFRFHDFASLVFPYWLSD